MILDDDLATFRTGICRWDAGDSSRKERHERKKAIAREFPEKICCGFSG